MLFLITALLASGATAASCNADNCLRALRAPNRLVEAQLFCAAFTQGSSPDTPIPTFAARACVQNQNAPQEERISSACSCIAPYTIETSMPATTMPVTSTVPTTLVSVTNTPPVSSSTPPSSSSGPITSSQPTLGSVSAPVSSSPTTSLAACALVASSSAAQIATMTTGYPTVPAQLAHDCLNSVPLNKTAGLALVDAMEPYLEWQSDSAFKKNPPADYFYPPHDIFGYLASVKTNLQNDQYANEYEFQGDLYQIFARAHDGHFVFYPDALTGALQFGRQRSLVSISEDGSSLPQIKIYEDVVRSPSTASAVTMINGIDAATYVADWAYTASFNQDADAAYNSMFYEKAFVASGTSSGYFGAGGRMRFIFPGANTTFTFANGTALVLDNIAEVRGDFRGVNDGKSFYQKFCLRPYSPPQGSVSTVAAASDLVIPPPPGYPVPEIVTTDAIVSGYYLNGTGYEDVAVLSLLAFESSSPQEFQKVAQQFIADAKADGKTKLVIDLSANGGGYILQGYDMFRLLFPDIIQDGFSRWRESDTLLAIAEVYSANAADFDVKTATYNEVLQYEEFFNYRYDLNLTNDPFTSFDAKFDPEVFQGDDFTPIIRWNLDDILTTINDTYGLGIDITGYGSRKNFTQPFAAEDIIMLYDGFCASTCTLFSEMMRIQGNVKSIAMGGRPQVGPIQGVGGIKGAQILSWSQIYTYSRTALQNATASQAAILKRLTTIPLQRSTATGINVRDQILRGNLDDGLPAQFVVEEADCRLYWTEDMITDVRAVWKAAADAAFNGRSCVAGGIAAAKKRDVDEEVKRASMEKVRNVVNEAIKRDEVEKREMEAIRLSEDWTAKHLLKAIP